ncbi:MAG: ABC transporter ATP-binding protein [Ignisphaera sp.]
MSKGVVVQLRNVVKTYRYGKQYVQALRGIDLDVQRSEIVCIVGPSGSGKTTLLNIIGGLDRVDIGKVIVDGIDLCSLNEREIVEFRLRKIGYVFQFYNLIPTLSVLENVELPMYLLGVKEKERKERAIELLQLVGIQHLANRTPDTLSGGEQQRVAIARALAVNPAIILMDEPTGALDTDNTKKLIDLIKKLNNKLGQTFIVATHDILVAKECTNIYTLRDGKITNVYKPSEIGRLFQYLV